MKRKEKEESEGGASWGIYVGMLPSGKFFADSRA
jgi:hypothetical protein